MLRLIVFFIIPSICFAQINLRPYEQKIFSQNGEDGITLAIFNLLGTTNKYYVEFGAENGIECNTRVLRESFDWQGLMMDGRFENKSINLHQEFITAENINDLFEKYQVPEEFDLLSIDIDFNDFYIWNTISSKYSPRVVIIEYNATHLPDEDKVVVYQPFNSWDGTNYFGASILSLQRLGERHGYTLVYADKCGVNLFFIRNDILEVLNLHFINENNVSKIYKPPGYGRGPNGGHFQDPLNRPFLSSEEILNASSKQE